MNLLDAADVEGLAEIAESLMNSEVRIWHSEDEDSVSAPPNDSWDDSVEAPSVSDGESEPTSTVRGWFRNQPDYKTTDAFEAIAHEEDGRLFVPLGTALARRDRVVVLPLDTSGNAVEPGTEYRVIDTNVENTWKVLIRASLKRVS